MPSINMRLTLGKQLFPPMRTDEAVKRKNDQLHVFIYGFAYSLSMIAEVLGAPHLRFIFWYITKSHVNNVCMRE